VRGIWFAFLSLLAIFRDARWKNLQPLNSSGGSTLLGSGLARPVGGFRQSWNNGCNRVLAGFVHLPWQSGARGWNAEWFRRFVLWEGGV
jgi:hypothetical protein